MILKTYIVSIDVTGGLVNPSRLHSEIDTAGHVNGFAGITLSADELCIIGDSFSDEVSLDALVLAHDGTVAIDGNWHPTAITLGDCISNGASVINSSGAGYYFNFYANANNEMIMNLGLERDGSSYDGSNVTLKIDYMLYGVPTSENVIFELDYAFIENGDNAYSSKDGTLSNTIDVSSHTSQIMYEESMSTISGPVGSKLLQMTLRRVSLGGGSDTYDGSVEIYGIQLIKG